MDVNYSYYYFLNAILKKKVAEDDDHGLKIRVRNGKAPRDQIRDQKPAFVLRYTSHRYFFFNISVNNITIKMAEPFLSTGTEKP